MKRRRMEQPTETFTAIRPDGTLVSPAPPLWRKYHNRPSWYLGQMYPSVAEATRATQLEMLRMAGEIVSWKRGERTLILDDGPGRRVWYTPDFQIELYGGDWLTEDVKGAVPRDFRLRALLYEMATGRPLRVVDKYGAVKWTPMGRRKRKGER